MFDNNFLNSKEEYDYQKINNKEEIDKIVNRYFEKYFNFFFEIVMIFIVWAPFFVFYFNISFLCLLIFFRFT